MKEFQLEYVGVAMRVVQRLEVDVAERCLSFATSFARMFESGKSSARKALACMCSRSKNRDWYPYRRWWWPGAESTICLPLALKG